ncbi:MAG: radical SAM protein [Nitrospirae bacterium]|nr:radical SAM protein [Nitrospirota bacterium]
MECAEQKRPSTDEYLTQFILKSRQLRIPLSGSLEVTYRCNLRCVHCYLGTRTERQERGSREMSAGVISSLIEEITDAGCLNLLLTGGEPLLRDDFPAIYRHAKEKGLLVTVFSNGTLVTEGIVALFRELPPFEVEISLYGATAGTYESVTRVPGSYEKCLLGIQRLVDAGIKVNLKTILMTLNSREFFAMEDIARKFGARFRFDAAISPGIEGDKAPLSLRVSPEEAVALEFSDGKRVHDWKRFFEESKGRGLVDCLYGCSAGVTGFHVDPEGYLQPCMMTFDVRYNLRGKRFLSGWNAIIARLKDKKAHPDFVCRGCKKINLCGYCPGFFKLENGAEDVRSDYICKMGGLRYRRIKGECEEGDTYEGESRKRIQATV